MGKEEMATAVPTMFRVSPLPMAQRRAPFIKLACVVALLVTVVLMAGSSPAIAQQTSSQFATGLATPQGGLVLSECRFPVSKEGQRVAGKHPGPDVIGPAFHVLGDLHPRVVCKPGLGQREGRLGVEERAPGRGDAGQRLAQHDGLGALGRVLEWLGQVT